mmetsp:Transcript_37019/g.55366  ORF Transcript_37019/g.55366 Transcript_37019/m.55366 type:complete len:150 (-) Transcript_37019:585-1034(-)
MTVILEGESQGGRSECCGSMRIVMDVYAMDVSAAKSACPKSMEMEMERLPLISFGVFLFLAFGGLAGGPPERVLGGARDKKWRAKGPRAGATESRAGTSATRNICEGWMSIFEGAVKARCAAGRERESGESFGVSTDKAKDRRHGNEGI